MGSLQEVIEQAEQHRTTSRILARGHYLKGKKCQINNRIVGLLAVVSSTIVGTSTFSAIIQGNPERLIQIIAVFFSLSAAVFSSLQTFLRFAEQAEKHYAAGANFAALSKQFDLFLLDCDPSQRTCEAARAELTRLVEKFNAIEANSLDMEDRYYNQAVEEARAKAAQGKAQVPKVES